MALSSGGLRWRHHWSTPIQYLPRLESGPCYYCCQNGPLTFPALSFSRPLDHMWLVPSPLWPFSLARPANEAWRAAGSTHVRCAFDCLRFSARDRLLAQGCSNAVSERSGTRFEATVHIQQTAKENNPSLGGLMSGTNRFNYACPHSKVIDPVSSNSLSPVSATSAGQMSCSSSASIHSVIKAMPQWSTEPYVDEMPKHGCLSSIPCFTYHQHA